MDLTNKLEDSNEGGILVTAGEYDNTVMIWRYGVKSDTKSI
jgi:hypothetical protein